MKAHIFLFFCEKVSIMSKIDGKNNKQIFLLAGLLKAKVREILQFPMNLKHSHNCRTPIKQYCLKTKSYVFSKEKESNFHSMIRSYLKFLRN